MEEAGCVLQRGGLWRVGNGKSIKAWGDKWILNVGPVVYREDVAASMNINFVSHLMLPMNGGWNRELVDYVCWPPTARAILAIPLPLQPGEDGFFWLATTDGRYSSKTGYQFICNERLANQASSSLGPSMSASLWNKLWRADAVPTCRETAWKACLGTLPVRTELHRRGVAPDPSCPWCLDAPETVEHTLLYCPRLRPM